DVASGRPYAMLVAIESLKSTVSWVTSPICARSDVWVTSRRSWPSMVMRPAVTSWKRGSRSISVDFPPPLIPTKPASCPVGKAGRRVLPLRFPPAAHPHEGHHLPARDGERDVVQGGNIAVRVGEADVLEADGVVEGGEGDGARAV